MLPPKLLSSLNQIIKIVNVVKTLALNTRLFKLICEDLGSDHTCLLYHTEVRWLSRGNITKRLFELRDELLVLLREKDHDFRKYLEDEEFIIRLAYLSDIFEAINQSFQGPNLSFQGPNCPVVEFISKLGAFILKLDLWKKNVESKKYGMFKFLTTLDRATNNEVCHEIIDHCSMLR